MSRSLSRSLETLKLLHAISQASWKSIHRLLSSHSSVIAYNATNVNELIALFGLQTLTTFAENISFKLSNMTPDCSPRNAYIHSICICVNHHVRFADSFSITHPADCFRWRQISHVTIANGLLLSRRQAESVKVKVRFSHQPRSQLSMSPKNGSNASERIASRRPYWGLSIET